MIFDPISDQPLHILEHNFRHSGRLSAGLAGLPGLSGLSDFSTPSAPPPSYTLNEPPSSGHDHFPNSSLPFPSPTIPSASSPSGLFLSDVPSQPLTWLWPGRIPLGHLTLLDAAPGSDPSLFALTIAASISSGSPLPDGTPAPQGNVILFAPYDSASDTLKPRLEAAGGNPAHVLLFRPTRPSAAHASPVSNHPYSFALPHGLPQLSATIRHHNARLVILDPASAINGLARCLPALIDLAQQTHCCILLIRSLRQPVADPLHTPGPASPLLEAARSRLLLIPDPDNESHCLLLTTRHLLCPQPIIPVLAFDLRLSAEGIPILHCLGVYDQSHLARLCTGPMLSPHRQAILRFLQNSTTPQTIPDILTATSYDAEAGRQMLIRMKMAGELVSPARGLYTTPNHPCLTQPVAPIEDQCAHNGGPTPVAKGFGEPSGLVAPVTNVITVPPVPNPLSPPITNVAPVLPVSPIPNPLSPPVTNVTTVPPAPTVAKT